MSISFPTKHQRGPSSYIAEVLKVYEGYNANYGPNGRKGLYIKIRFERGTTRDIFYPEPPSTKTERLLNALNDDLKLDLAQLGWMGLEGYKFRWVNEEVDREILDRETKKPTIQKTRLEYPVEIISEPVAASVLSSSHEEAVSSNGSASVAMESNTANYETFKDEVVALADNRDQNQLRVAAATSRTIRDFPKEFRDMLNKGNVLEELQTEGRITQDEKGVFHLVS